MDIRDLLSGAQDRMRSSYSTGAEALLDRAGLERQRTTTEIVLPAIAIFGTGLTVGALLGLLFAPKRGDELRADLGHRLSDAKDLSVKRYERLVHPASGDADDEMPDRTRTTA